MNNNHTSILLDKLHEQRTQMFEIYLELLDIRLQQAQELGIDNTLDLRTIHIDLARRSGSTTWVKAMLEKYPDSIVVTTPEYVKRVYTSKALDVTMLIAHTPLSFTDQLVFFDLPIDYKSKVNKYIDICSYGRAFIIV
jgi:hypothetical protein